MTATSLASPPASVQPPRGRAEGYFLTQRDGVALYSVRVRHGRFRLVSAFAKPERARRVGVPDAATPFRVDLGTDAERRTIAVYPRCAAGVCRIVVLDPSSGRERVLAPRLPQGSRIPLMSVDRGIVTYVRSAGHRSTLFTVPVNGSRGPRAAFSIRAAIAALDTSPRGLAYAAYRPDPDGAHARTTLYLRHHATGLGRRIGASGWGEEGGADIVSVSFSDATVVWGISGYDAGATFGELWRRDLRTNRLSTLSVPGGGLISAAPDSANPSAPLLIAHHQSSDPDDALDQIADEIVERFPASGFGPAP